MVFVTCRLTVAGAVGVAAGFPWARLVRLRAVLVLIACRLTLTGCAVRVAAGFPWAGLVRLRAVLVLIACRLTLTCCAIRVAARFSWAKLVWLRAVLVLITCRHAVARGAISVATGHGDHGRLRRCFAWAAFGGPATDRVWIFQPGLNILPCLTEVSPCLS